MRVLILGSTGMLGNKVGKFFETKNYETIMTYRNEENSFGKKRFYFDALKDSLEVLPQDVDYVINCIGVIKPYVEKNIQNTILLNALFPLKLAEWCQDKGIRLIHITTDCVYSGAKGKYIESDVHDAGDVYGKTKSLGECNHNAMVLRTSIIGEEIHKNASLVSWAKSMRGQNIQGYINHLWNGITTNEYAKVCEKIIINNWYQEGLFHVCAKDDVSKYDILCMLNKKYNLNLVIEKYRADPIDRTLRTEKGLCEKLKIPTVSEMIEEM